MDLSLFSQNYANLITSLGGDKRRALLKVSTDLTNNRTTQLSADLESSIAKLEKELRDFYPKLLNKYPQLNNRNIQVPLQVNNVTGQVTYANYDEALDISNNAEQLAVHAREYYERSYRYGIGVLDNVAEIKIPSSPITPAFGARVAIIPGDQGYKSAATAPELTGTAFAGVAEGFQKDLKGKVRSIGTGVIANTYSDFSNSPASELNDRLKGVETIIKVIADESRRQGISPQVANEFVNNFTADIDELRKKTLEIFIEINQTVQREMSYVKTREEIFALYDARRKKDYYAKVTNTQADSSNPKVYDEAKVQADLNARKSAYDRKITELETTGVSTMDEIVKLQEQFIFPGYAIEELKDIGRLLPGTATRLRDENQKLRSGTVIRNQTSVLPSAYTPKTRNPAEWRSFPSSEEIDVVVATPGVAGTMNDVGAKGKGFNEEAVKVVFNMVETYQKRVLDVDKKRKEIAIILWEKTNGGAGAITNDILVEYPVVGQYTIADEIKIYLSRSDLSDVERKKMELLKIDLAKLLVGEIDPLFPEKGPLLPLANKIREYAHSLGIAEKDEKNGLYGLIFDYTGPGERPEDGQARAAIFDPLVSADAQVFKTIGRQHITDDDKVSNFAFDITENERQIHPKGYLGSLANDELLTTQVDVNGETHTVRSNSGFVDKIAWRELVNNTSDQTIVRKKEEIERAFRADMYRNYAEKTLGNAWRADFKNRLIAELSGPGGLYEGLTPDEIEQVINKSGAKNVRLSEGGNILGSYTNLDLLADLSLETFSRTYGSQISTMQEILRNTNRMRGQPGSISDVDPVTLFRFVERRFSGSVSGVTVGGISQQIDENIQSAFRYIDTLKHSNQPGYFSPIRTLDDNVINIALYNVGRNMAQATFVPIGNTNLRIDKILPTSNMYVGLNLDQSGVPVVSYKEHRLVNYDGEVTPQNIGNVIKVVKELEAKEVPSEHILRVLGMLTGAQSPEMVKLVNDAIGYDPKSNKVIIKNELETRSIIGDAQKKSEQINKNLNNFAMSWMIGTEGADIALKAYRGPLGDKATIRRDILDPEGIVDDVLTKKQNLGFGVKLKQDFYNWTLGEPSKWIDISKAWDPKAKPKDGIWLDTQIKILDAWKEHLPIIGKHEQGGVFGHFKRTGALPGMNVPFVLGNRPLIGDYEGNGLKILTDMTGGAPLSPEKWVSTRLQYMIGSRAIIEGKEVNVMGYKVLNGWEQGVNKFVNESWIGKTAQLGKKHPYEKRKDKSIVREVGSILIDATVGLAKVGLYKVGQVMLDVPVVGRALRYTGNLPVVTGTVENISKTVGALKAVSPIARAVTVGATNAGLVGVPVWFVVGGGAPGIIAGVISGGLVGVSKGLTILAKPETSAAIEKFMGFERLNNIALNEQYLVKIGGTSADALRTTNLTTGQLKAGEKYVGNLFATSAYWDDALVKAGGYVRWLSPNGFYGKSLKSIYNYINEVTPEARIFNAYGGESTRLATAQKTIGILGRSSIIGAAAYALSGGSVLLGAGALLGSASLEIAARRLIPSIAVKLQFLGETASGRTLANALTKMNDFRVHFPLLDTLGLIQTTDYLNQAILIPTTHLLRGNIPLNVYLFGGSAKMDLWNLSLNEARALGVSDRVYFDALHRSAASGYHALMGGGFSISSWGEANPSGYNSFVKSGLSIEEWGKSDPTNYKDYLSQKSAYDNGKLLRPELEYHYKGLLSPASLGEAFLYLGAGYIPIVSAYSSAVYTLSQRMGIKNIWGGWYANRFETAAEKSILYRMQNSKGIIKILGDAIDNPFGALPQGVRTGAGYAIRGGGAIAGGYGGYLLALSLGINNPWVIGGFVAGGAIGGYAATSALLRGGTYIWNNVITGWLRVPLAAGGGLLSYASPLIGGAIGGGVASLAGFGTFGYWAAVGVGTVVGAIVIPGVGGFLGVAIGSAAAAGSAYVAGYLGDWFGSWWNKTVGFAMDGLKSISPLLALVRVFNSLNRADLGQFVAAIFQFAYSFSLGIAATGVVLTAVVPPLVTPSAAPAAGGTYIAPYNKLITKQFVVYDKDKNVLKYQLNVNASVLGITKQSATIELKDIPQEAGNITFLTDGECAQFNGQFQQNGTEITLVDTNFDSGRLNTNICLQYEVTPKKALSEYSNFCNIFSGKISNPENPEDTQEDGGVQCVSSKGQNLGINAFETEGNLNDQAITPTGNPIATGTGFFPVDPNDPKVGGCQCPYGGSSHTAGGMIDICGPDGTPVMAWQDGEVMSVGYYSYNSYIYGLMIHIKHSNGIETWYAHMATSSVKKGDQVKGGQVIGTMGASTGKGNAGMYTHVHFETRSDPNGTSPNPCAEMIDCKKYNVTPKTSHISCFLDNGGSVGKLSGAMYAPTSWRKAYSFSETPPSAVAQPNVHPWSPTRDTPQIK